MPTASANTPAKDSISTNSSTEKIENYILRERGLELGFEGRRWYDLMRVARHQGTPAFPNVNLIINAVLPRIPADQQAAIITTLSDPKKWYLPYNYEEKKLNPNLK